MRAVAILAVLAFVSLARAEEPRVRCTVRSILALKTEGGMDAKLEPLKHILKEDPLTIYKTFRLLDEQSRDLPQKKAEKFKLVNGKTLTLTFLERLLDSKERTRLRFTVDYPGVSAQQKIADGATMPLVLPGEHKGETLVLATTCKTR